MTKLYIWSYIQLSCVILHNLTSAQAMCKKSPVTHHHRPSAKKQLDPIQPQMCHLVTGVQWIGWREHLPETLDFPLNIELLIFKYIIFIYIYIYMTYECLWCSSRKITAYAPPVAYLPPARLKAGPKEPLGSFCPHPWLSYCWGAFTLDDLEVHMIVYIYIYIQYIVHKYMYIYMCIYIYILHITI